MHVQGSGNLTPCTSAAVDSLCCVCSFTQPRQRALVFVGGSTMSAINASIHKAGKARFLLRQLQCISISGRRLQYCESLNSQATMLQQSACILVVRYIARRSSIAPRTSGCLSAEISDESKLRGMSPLRSVTRSDTVHQHGIAVYA